MFADEPRLPCARTGPGGRGWPCGPTPLRCSAPGRTAELASWPLATPLRQAAVSECTKRAGARRPGTCAARRDPMGPVRAQGSRGSSQLLTQGDEMAAQHQDQYQRQHQHPHRTCTSTSTNISISTAITEEEVDLALANATLVKVKAKIDQSTKKHNQFLKELGLPPLP